MELIVKESELVNNIETVESYLAEDDAYINGEVLKLVKRGTCFVAYTINSEIRFAPSRFLGYKNNKLDKHKRNRGHGSHTNRVISKILGTQPLPNKKLEKLYLAYCNNLGIKPSISGAFGAERKFWSIDIFEDFADNLDLTGEFPEGKIVERKHKARERNAAVILIAKENFKINTGSYFAKPANLILSKHTEM